MRDSDIIIPYWTSAGFCVIIQGKGEKLIETWRRRKARIESQRPAKEGEASVHVRIESLEGPLYYNTAADIIQVQPIATNPPQVPQRCYDIREPKERPYDINLSDQHYGWDL